MGPWAIAIAIALQTGAPTPTPAPPPDNDPLTHLFHNLVRDLIALPSTDAAVILGVGAGATLAAHPADDNLADWARRSGHSSYASFGRVLGNGWVQSGGAVLTYVVGRLADHEPTIHIGSDLIRAQTLNGLLTTATKRIVNRARPTGHRYAFPSGHTSAAFTSAAIFQGHFGWRVGAPAYAVAGFIGLTRVRDGQHWITDVLAGATIGTIVGYRVSAGHRTRTWTIIPAATSGGLAVYVVKTR